MLSMVSFGHYALIVISRLLLRIRVLQPAQDILHSSVLYFQEAPQKGTSAPLSLRKGASGGENAVLKAHQPNISNEN